MFIKRKDFEELKNRVEVLEFQRDHPNGLEIKMEDSGHFGLKGYVLHFIKDKKVKFFILPMDFFMDWELLENNELLMKKITSKIDGWCNIQKELYEFDIENEMLIKIKEVEKPTTKKGVKNKNGFVDKKSR